MIELGVTILSVIVIAVSLWAIFYFGGRVVLRLWVRGQLGDMPSEKEISALYESNNRVIEYLDWNGLDHSPTPPDVSEGDVNHGMLL